MLRSPPPRHSALRAAARHLPRCPAWALVAQQQLCHLSVVRAATRPRGDLSATHVALFLFFLHFHSVLKILPLLQRSPPTQAASEPTITAPPGGRDSCLGPHQHPVPCCCWCNSSRGCGLWQRWTPYHVGTHCNPQNLLFRESKEQHLGFSLTAALIPF
jgi:hypothetical protein